MFENIILVLKIEEKVGASTEEAIGVYRVEGSVFNHIAHMPAMALTNISQWLTEQGYKRAVAFDPDDAISGLYAKEESKA